MRTVVVVSNNSVRTIKSSEEMIGSVFMGGVIFPNVNNFSLGYLDVERLVTVVKFMLISPWVSFDFRAFFVGLLRMRYEMFGTMILGNWLWG